MAKKNHFENGCIVVSYCRRIVKLTLHSEVKDEHHVAFCSDCGDGVVLGEMRLH